MVVDEVGRLPSSRRLRTQPGGETALAASNGHASTNGGLVAHAYDPEVLGGDTCDLGQCCMNPCGYLLKVVSRCFHNCFRENSTVRDQIGAFMVKRMQQLVYIAGTYGAWAIIFRYIYPLIRESPNVASYHMSVGYVVFAMCVLSWRFAASTSPGSITKESLHKFDNYHYDNTLYVQKICPTLHIRKLPRSKYDRYTDTHVPRFDHHCHVLQQSIGEENYRLFLLFLTIHTGMLWYGGIVVGRLLWDEVLRNPVYDNSLKNFRLKLASRLIAVAFANIGAAFADNYLVAFMAFLFFCATMLTAFLCFHVYLVACGMTTNEYYKWKEVAMEYTESYHGKGTSKNCSDEESPVAEKNGPRWSSTTTMPRNTYDLGILVNATEVIFPRSIWRRKTAHEA
jgi:hypothetical protein